MRFGISILMSQHDSQPEHVVFRQAVEQVQFAEELGFHSVWLTEQHFNTWGICPDPLAFAAHLAGVTHTIRLGTGVVVLPLHNPIIIAERAALVDQLSGGRLDLGIGKGHPRQQFDVFGIEAQQNEDRFYEAHDLIIRAWTEETFSFHGRFYHAEDVKINPKPFQQPHPPLWVATFGNPGGITFAAQHGYPILQTSTGSNLTRNLDTYRTQYVHASEPTLTVMRGVYLLPDGDQARAEMRAPARWYLENNPSRPDKVADTELAVYEFISTLSIIGSPEECIERIRGLRDESEINYLICIFGPGGVPHERILETMQLFADEVMPEFAT